MKFAFKKKKKIKIKINLIKKKIFFKLLYKLKNK